MDIHELIKKLDNPDEAERIYAAQDIAEKNQPDMALPLFRRFQTEDSPAVRDSILFSLKNLPCKDIYNHIFKLFKSSDAYMRNAALSVFSSGGDESLGFLTLHMGDSDREVRKLILDALFAIGTPDAVLAVRAALHDPSVNVQITAVEYLGRLEDKDSADDLLALFQKETEPMLRTAILDSLSMIGDKSAIMKVLSILIPEEKTSEVSKTSEVFAGIDPIYIPEVIRLAAQAGDTEYISKILDAVSSFKIYANDIIRAIDLARHRFKDSFREELIFEKLIEIAEDKEIPEDSRNAAAELLSEEENVVAFDKLDDLGTELITEEGMKYAGVRLLAISGKMSGYAKIRKIMEETKDEELRLLCEELLDVDRRS